MWLEKNHHLICLVAALCCRRVTLLGSSWQLPPRIRSSAGPWLSPSGCCVSRQQSSSGGWETAQHLPACWVLAAQGREVRKSKASPPCAKHPWAALSSCNASRNVASISPWWSSKTNLQAKAARLSTRAAGNPPQLVPCPSHGVPSTRASS